MLGKQELRFIAEAQHFSVVADIPLEELHL